MEQSDDDESISIDPKGDVFLRVASADAHTPSICYRVLAAKLRAESAYFRTLFDPYKFDEGIRLAAERHLASGQGQQQPSEDGVLPLVSLPHVGLPLKYLNKDLFASFLRCAHEPGALQNIDKWTFPPIYQLARVADRFMARDSLKSCMQHVRYSAKHSPRAYKKGKNEMSERMCRQKLIIGLWYNFEEWVSFFSWRLVVQGSKQWDETAADEGEVPNETEDMELWHLPEGLEEELECRRACILETLGSVQDTLVSRYLSKERVCKSGLDSSLQCDLFQLGQALRFLSRKELVSLKSLVSGQDFKPSSSESILKICAALVECPSYQIDPFHQNCGLRTRLVRCVELIQQHVSTDAYIGVCLACWRSRRSEYSWLDGVPGASKREMKGHGTNGKWRHDHGREIVDLFSKGSFVERCESGWRPQNWRFQWMHGEDGGANGVERGKEMIDRG